MSTGDVIIFIFSCVYKGIAHNFDSVSLLLHNNYRLTI